MKQVAYNRRDLILYALAVGVDHNELQYLYELDPSFTALPTYPLVLQSKGDGFDVNSFAEEVSKGGKTPGLPEYDLNNLVHGEQGMEVLRTVPLEGNYTIRSKISGVYDKGSGMVIETIKTLVDEQNVEYVKMTTRMFVIGYGGWGVSSCSCFLYCKGSHAEVPCRVIKDLVHLGKRFLTDNRMVSTKW